MENILKIAVDAMGGDYAPREIVTGAVRAANSIKGLEKLYLVGDVNAIEDELKKISNKTPNCIEVISASEVVEMGEAPASAIRKKKDSSISVGLRLVKEKKADGFVSAGNTGAVMAASTLILGRIPGIERPG